MVLPKPYPPTHIDYEDWNAVINFLGEGYRRYVADFVIFVDDVDFLAQNGKTGIIDYGGSKDAGGIDGGDAAAVINEALIQGGLSQLSSGLFEVGTVVKMRDDSALRGLGKTSIIKAKAGLDDSVIENADHGTGNKDFSIENLSIDGNKTNQADILDVVNGINLDYSYDFEIRNVFLKNVREQSIRIGAGCYDGLIFNPNILDGDWTGIGVTAYDHDVVLRAADRPQNIDIELGRIKNCREFAIDIENSDYCSAFGVKSLNMPQCAFQIYESAYCRFIGLYAKDTVEFGIRTYVSNAAKIIGCVVDEYDTGGAGIYDGIYIESDRNLVASNHVASLLGRYSLNIAAGQWNEVEGNWLAGYPMTAFNDDGTDTKEAHNYGWVSENSVIATILINTSSIQVAHGLNGIPKIAMVTGRHDETKAAHVTARDGTNITITVPVNVTADRIVDCFAVL